LEKTIQLLEEENKAQTLRDLAKRQDKDAIDKLLATTTVDAFFGRDNAIYLLASEGDAKAVNFLLEHYGANPNWAVMGAAAGGHFRLVYWLLGRGSSLSYAMYGAGQSGNMDLVNALEKQGGDIFWAVSGAAGSEQQRDFYDQVNKKATAINRDKRPWGDYLLLYGSIVQNRKLFDQLRSTEEDNIAFLSLSIGGAAANGNAAFVKELMQAAAELPVDSVIKPLHFALAGAHAGHHTDLIGQLRQDRITHSAIQEAANGAAAGGHVDLILKLISRFPRVKSKIISSVYQAAEKGHLSLVTFLIGEGARASVALEGAAKGGQIRIINALLKHGTPKVCHELAYELAQEGYLSTNPDEILRIATTVDDPILRECIIKEAVKRNKTITVKDVEDMIKKSEVLHDLMRKKNFSYYQALAWTIPQIRVWILQSQGTLPKDLVLKIASFISPLTDVEIMDLYRKLSVMHEKNLADFKSLKTHGFKLSEKTEQSKPDDKDLDQENQEEPKP
jgi:hypothetical protein